MGRAVATSLPASISSSDDEASRIQEAIAASDLVGATGATGATGVTGATG